MAVRSMYTAAVICVRYAFLKAHPDCRHSLSRCELIVNLCCQENKYGNENTDSIKIPGNGR